MLYTIFYNYTLADSIFLKPFTELAPVDPILLQLKNSVDNSILSYLSSNQSQESPVPVPRIEVTHSSYP